MTKIECVHFVKQNDEMSTSFYCDKSFVPTNRENTLWGVMHCRNTQD